MTRAVVVHEDTSGANYAVLAVMSESECVNFNSLRIGLRWAGGLTDRPPLASWPNINIKKLHQSNS